MHISKTLAALTLATVSAAAQSWPSHASPADSRPKLTPAPTAYRLGVSPRSATPGTPRTITFGGFWSSTCGPSSISIAPATGSQSNALGIMVNLPLTAAPCTADLRPYNFQATYTPLSEGQSEVIAFTNFGQPLAASTIVTAWAEQPKAVFDISGAWIDNNNRGAGLMVAHGWGRQDVVLATWQTYDSSGIARWYSLQETRWSGDGSVLEGVLMETRAAPVACPACPTPVNPVIRVGRARLTVEFNGANGGLDAKFEQISDAGDVRLLANFSRLRL